jgi:hypothetical protein
LKQLLSLPKSASVQFLLQCADWQESDYEDRRWLAYSPINRYWGGTWPLYDLDGLTMSKDGVDLIEFHSWKDDYYPQTYEEAPCGNLGYRGKHYSFKGTVWTRG